MFKLKGLIVSMLLLTMLFISCGDDTKDNGVMNSQMAKLATGLINIPAGATIESATMFIVVREASGQEINVHQVTSDWDEMVVTFNNFGGAYAPAVLGTFTADAVGWTSVEVTQMVKDWVSGDAVNYGVLLSQINLNNPRTLFGSREFSKYAPYIEVCYTIDAGTFCATTLSIADAQINERYGDLNFGPDEWLASGRYLETELDKQSLIRFEFPVVEEELAAIGDFVWEDLNQDGIQDAGETGVSGVTVYLLNCQGEIIATTITNASGAYLFDQLQPGDYKIQFILPSGYEFSPQDQGADDAMDSDADPTTGEASCTTLDSGEYDLTWDAGVYMPVIDCFECDGKITNLTLEYQGSLEALVEVFAKAGKDGLGELLFSGPVLPGGSFNIVGFDKNGTVGTEISLFVDGVLNTKIHTSCSKPIYIGMVSGFFEILDGYSLNGGRLCPGEGGVDCRECDGKITNLTLEYQGSLEALVEVFAKAGRNELGETLFSGQVLSGGSFNFVGFDRHGTMGTEISIFVDGVLNTKIHTSCSQPIYIGMISGDFEVLDGYSQKGGRLCPDEGDNNDGGDGPSDCDGKVTSLTLEYQGASEAFVEVFAKGKKHKAAKVLFSGQVLPDGNLNIIGYDKNGTVGTEITIFVDGIKHTKIHTSCSQPIYIGMVSGDFEILNGYSKNGGQLGLE